MKLDKEHIETLKTTFERIRSICNWFEENREDFGYNEERLNEMIEEEENIETIDIFFPGEQEYAYIEIDEFLRYSIELPSFEIVNKGYIKTQLYRYYIVSANDSNQDYMIRGFYEFESLKVEGLQVRLVSESFFVGLAATHLEIFDKDYWGTYSQYLAIEVQYDDITKVLSPEEEMGFVHSYLFELADTLGIALAFSEISDPKYDYDDMIEEAEETINMSLRALEPYNEGMKFYVSAVQIQDPEFKFLNFYKVLEHFSPVAINIEANELMRKKLDAPKSALEDGDFIRSIFDLANSVRDRFNDEDLILSSFSNCFDFVGLFRLLPESIKKIIRKQVGINELLYSTEKQKILLASNIAGRIIYKTRNKVVHAKSNFRPTGDELSSSEYIELNAFMKEASSQAIRWYSRLPKHLMLEIIK
ncbi:MAG: hypothetical protein V2B15_01285 [Bacteroidota bacterium]